MQQKLYGNQRQAVQMFKIVIVGRDKCRSHCLAVTTQASAAVIGRPAIRLSAMMSAHATQVSSSGSSVVQRSM